MNKIIRKITTGKQITLPIEFCKQNGLSVGEYVCISSIKDKLIIEPYVPKSKTLEKLEILFNQNIELNETEENILNMIDKEIEAARK